jgi:hypothetical protein
MAKQDISFQTEHGRTEDGQRIYTRDEYRDLKDVLDRLSDRDYKDWIRAPVEGRIRSEDEDTNEDEAGGGMESMSTEERAKALNQPRHGSTSSTGDTSSSDTDRPMEEMSAAERVRRLNGRSW